MVVRCVPGSGGNTSSFLEFRRGRKDGGWYLICESNVTGYEVEAYSIELANELIGDTQQIAGVEVLKEAED